MYFNSRSCSIEESGDWSSPGCARDYPTELPTTQSDLAGKEVRPVETKAQETLEVKAGDGYWKLAARRLHIEGQTWSDQQNDAVLHLMQQLEKLNGNKMLHTGEHLEIPPLAY